MTLKLEAQHLLDQLIELDMQTTHAYYEMGRILHALYESRMHEVLGYTSFTHLVEEELSYSQSTAQRYRHIYSQFKRLHYTKTEALKLMQTFGMTHMADVLPGIRNKISPRAIKQHIYELDFHQINFQLTTEELAASQRALIKMGAVVTDQGRFLNSSQAYMVMVREINRKSPNKKAA